MRSRPARTKNTGPRAKRSKRVQEPHPVAIVVVTWNSSAEIDACLASAFAAQPAEVVVVDNGSKDDTLARVRHNYPLARVLPQPKNVGFAAGCNLGIGVTTAPYLLMQNADAVLAQDYLKLLVASLARHPEAASAVGKLVYEEGGKRYIDSAGITIRHYALCPLDRGLGEEDRGQYDKPEEIFGPSAAAALYRRSALEAVGPEIFEASLFAYYEDVDLAWRLNRAGFTHRYEPSAIAFHCRRGPAGKPKRISEQAFVNRYRVFAKNESAHTMLLVGPLAVAWETARILRRGGAALRLLRVTRTALREVAQILRGRVRGGLGL